MSEDLSTLIKLGVTVLLEASVIAAVASLVILALGMYNAFNSKIITAFTNVPISTVRGELNQREYVTGANVWRVLQEFYGVVDVIEVYTDTGMLDESIYSINNFQYFIEQASTKYTVRFSTIQNGFDTTDIMVIKEVE